jgi:hypothetical protein
VTVWLQSGSDGYFIDHNVWTAFEGFSARGHECKPFRVEQLHADLLPREKRGALVVQGPLEPGDIVCGGVGTVRQALRKLGHEPPPPLDYPEALKTFLGRRIEKATWKDFAARIHSFEEALFVKPVSHKTWTGQLVREFKDLIPIGNPEPDFPVWVSTPIDFVSEYRCMILRNEIRAMRLYKGDPFIVPERSTVQAMVEAMRVYDLAAYSLDVGVVKWVPPEAPWQSVHVTHLVEVNDSYSLGCYGPDSNVYAQMIEARWEQMTAT